MTHEEQLTDSNKRFENIDTKLDKIYNKLFEDNGAPCLQTRVDRNTRWIGSVKWLWCVIASATIGLIAWTFRK